MMFGDQLVREDTIKMIMAFMMLFFYAYIFLFMCLLVTGLNFHTVYAALTASIGNIGASIGEVSTSYESINLPAKYI